MAKANATLYLVGGAVALGIAAAYFLFMRPKPAYAVGPAPRPAPESAPPPPGLPGPGVPAVPEPTGPPEFPGAARALVVPVSLPGGQLAEIRIRPNGQWFGYRADGGTVAGVVWQSIGDAARDQRVVILGLFDAEGNQLWAQGQFPPIEAYA